MSDTETLRDPTPRELQVAALVAEGLSYTAIAAQLEISDRTVQVHVSNLSNKLPPGSGTPYRRVLIWALGQDELPTL